MVVVVVVVVVVGAGIGCGRTLSRDRQASVGFVRMFRFARDTTKERVGRSTGRPEHPGQGRVLAQENVEDALLGHDGPVGDGEGAPVDGADDGGRHLLDQDGDDGDGGQGPDDEEGLADVGPGRYVAVSGVK